MSQFVSIGAGWLPDDGASSWELVAATAGLVWYLVVLAVSAVGHAQLRAHHARHPPPAISSKLPLENVPHVTIIRPVKGPEPYLYECLAASFHQTYPSAKLSICFCVSSQSDPSLPVLQHLLADFPGFDAKILIEEEDPWLQDLRAKNSRLGPNPKIRNLSRGYREAKGDIVWILDCNVWVAPGAGARMVDKLCGIGPVQRRRYKFVHQLPLVFTTRDQSERGGGQQWQKSNGSHQIDGSTPADSKRRAPLSFIGETLERGGANLEETFMASSHAKFYTAINTVALAPCILGKSNMFRRSHLNDLTAGHPQRAPGIDSFSDYICEDHLIGDMLWKKKIEAEKEGEIWGKHALLLGDAACQPLKTLTIGEYFARRVRWIRVRKYTVTLATLVEPGTESFLCSFYGAYGFATFLRLLYGIDSSISWAVFASFWLCSVTVWAYCDWKIYCLLRRAAFLGLHEPPPAFVCSLAAPSDRHFADWLLAWLGRELLAFPIWVWAVFGGTTVEWRGMRFWVGMNMMVHALPAKGGPHTVAPASRHPQKMRRD